MGVTVILAMGVFEVVGAAEVVGVGDVVGVGEASCDEESPQPASNAASANSIRR